MQKMSIVFGCVVLLSACATPAPKYEYTKEGVSSRERDSASSACQYEIRLGKTPNAEANGLQKV